MATTRGTVVIPERYRGPPESANGGYACALLARYLDAPAVEVTLRRPPPLERALEVRIEGERALLFDAEELVAEAEPTAIDIEPPLRVSEGEAIAAARRFRGFEDNPFPTCFACGPRRATGDGLRVFPGPVEGAPAVAAPWTPASDLADESGAVAAPFVWAALDCPSGWAHVETRLTSVLGRMAAQILEPVRAGVPYVVVARPTGAEGRRQFAESALLTLDGRAIAVARATWVVVE